MKAMKSLRLTLALAGAAVALSPLVAQVAPIGIGKPAPAFTLKDSSGRQVSLAQFRGKTVVLEWADADCGYVLKHYNSGNMPKLQRDAKAQGVVWLTINSSDPGAKSYADGAKLTKWIASEKWSGANYLLDPSGQVGHMYRATATPGMYIIDKGGKLVYAGAIDSIPSQDFADIKVATNYVRQALNEINAGKPVSRPVTRAYGCTVKYKGV